MTDKQRFELLCGLAVVLLAGTGLFWLIPNHTNQATGVNDLPPRLVPQISLGLCLILGFGIVIRNLTGARRNGTPEDRASQPDLDDLGETQNETGNGFELAVDLAVWTASSVSVMLLLPRVGFIVTGFLLLAGWMIFVGVRSIPVILSVALILPVILDRLCWYALTVQLP